MKRELKARYREAIDALLAVEEPFPMKRELKEVKASQETASHSG